MSTRKWTIVATLCTLLIASSMLWRKSFDVSETNATSQLDSSLSVRLPTASGITGVRVASYTNSTSGTTRVDDGWTGLGLPHALLKKYTGTLTDSKPVTTSSKKDRSASFPFVTGDGFRSVCDYHYDDAVVGILSSHAPMLVSQLSTHFWQWLGNRSKNIPAFRARVFVQTHHLGAMLGTVMLPLAQQLRPSPGEKARGVDFIVLVTHNSDYSAPWEKDNTRGKFGVTEYRILRASILGDQFSDRIAKESAAIFFHRWYAQNVIFPHPKLFAIPIGIENRYNAYGAYVKTYLQKAISAPPFTQRDRLLYVNFNPRTNPRARVAALASLKRNFEDKASLVTFRTPTKVPVGKKKETVLSTYLEEMSRHRFVATPPGHGLDTHRTWEALYMGCIPIVQASAMDETLMRHLPVLIVRAYDVLSPEFLSEKEEELLERVNASLLDMNVWEHLLKGI